MNKYVFYKITYDTGFAPNPFGDYLTLATCTPNHCRSTANIGNYIIGVEASELSKKRKAKGYKTNINQSLIYIAKISEVLTLDDYFNDKRFEYKKYTKNKTWIERRGDNVYFFENDTWKWIRNHDHDFEKQDDSQFIHKDKVNEIFKKKDDKGGYGAIAQDIRGNRVFISKEFMYFGDKCINFDSKFSKLLPGRGTKYNHDEGILNKFKEYIEELKKEYGYGKHGNPINCHIKDYCKDKEKLKISCKG